MSRPLRETPFRLFFPVAGLLALQGVAPWLAHWITIDAPGLAAWLGLETPYRGPEHALVQPRGARGPEHAEQRIRRRLELHRSLVAVAAS